MTTIRTADYAADIPWLLSSTGDVSIAVAYVSKGGLDIVKPQIEALLRDNQQVRFLIDLHSGNTDPSAVWSLVELQDSHEGIRVRQGTVQQVSDRPPQPTADGHMHQSKAQAAARLSEG